MSFYLFLLNYGFYTFMKDFGLSSEKKKKILDPPLVAMTMLKKPAIVWRYIKLMGPPALRIY